MYRLIPILCVVWLVSCSAGSDLSNGSSLMPPRDGNQPHGAEDQESPAAGGVDSGDRSTVTVNDSDILSPLLDFLEGGYSSGNHRLAEQERIVAECMLGRGWVYYPLNPAADVEEDRPRTVGALREWRQRYGFELVAGPEATSGAREVLDANSAVWEALAPGERVQYLVDLNGGILAEGESPDPGSCRGHADTQARAPIDDPSVTAISGREFAAISSHPEMVSAFREWSACMLERGYDFPSPREMIEILMLELRQRGQEFDAGAFLLREIAVASASFECEFATTISVQIRLEREIVQRIVDDFPEYAELAS